MNKLYELENLACFPTRLACLIDDQKKREPLCYPNFNKTLRTKRYLQCLKICGKQWIGIKFYFSLIWCASQKYRYCYSWENSKDESFWENISRKYGYYEMAEVIHCSYNRRSIHHEYSYPISSQANDQMVTQRCATTSSRGRGQVLFFSIL